MTGFTLIFPLLGIITLPLAIMIVFSIVSGDISFIDEEINPFVTEEE
tara:strand:+ start:843 stop:983 length:141 start_codon:yes stop_codon:yes gene_type:complete